MKLNEARNVLGIKDGTVLSKNLVILRYRESIKKEGPNAENHKLINMAKDVLNKELDKTGLAEIIQEDKIKNEK